LLRSSNQLRLLSALLLEPSRSYTITELAERTGIPQPSVSREVANLLKTSALKASIEHRRRVVQANTDSPIFPELASLMLKTAGPQIVLEKALGGVPGIDKAYIYGSWARRYAGEVGGDPNDIDLLVIGAPDVNYVRRRADQASDELGRDVNVTVLSSLEWADSESGFVRHIRASPLVSLSLPPPQSNDVVPPVPT